MLRLFGLLTCASLAFIFPLFAYEMNGETLEEMILSTTIGTVLISILLK
jgi:hypothetical protein